MEGVEESIYSRGKHRMGWEYPLSIGENSENIIEEQISEGEKAL